MSSKAKHILLFIVLVFNITYSQNNFNDSTAYKALLKQFNILLDADRKKALQIANQTEKLSIKNKHPFFLANALFNKAISYYFDSQFDSCCYFAAKALEPSRISNNYIIQMKANNILGAVYYVKGDLVNAERYYFEKLKIAHSIRDTASEMGTYYNIGLIYFQQGNYFKSAESNFKALDYFEQKNDTFNILTSLHAIAFTYMHLEDNTAALAYFKKAIHLTKLNKDEYELSGLYIDLSAIYTDRGNWDTAVYYIDLALKIAVKQKDEFHFIIATNHKAVSFLQKKMYNQALVLIKEAEILALKSDRKLNLCEIYDTKAKIYFGKNKLDSSLIYAYKAYAIGAVMNKVDLLLRTVKTLSDIYETKNNNDSAFKYYKLLSHYKDTVKTQNQLRGIAQKEFLYEKHNQEILRSKEQAVAQTKLEKQKQINLIIAVASVLLLIVLIIGVINFRQKQKANAQVLIQKKLLEEKNKEVQDSINYASRIQKSIMLDDESIKEILPDSFVLYLPKDVVSGDFYWITALETRANKTMQVVAVADCTGHGVPGAFMSLIGATILNQSLSVDYINNPAEALDFLNIELPKNIKSSSSSGTINDGMEICMCAIDRDKMELQFAGANNNLYLIRNNKLHLFKGDKHPIGRGYESVSNKFTNKVIPLFKNDIIYMSSDGYPDQFGGPKAKKFKYKQMEELFLSIAQLPMIEQKDILHKNFTDWKGNLDQIDDVLILGLKI